MSWIARSPVDARLKMVFPVPELAKVSVSALSWVMVVFPVKLPPSWTLSPVLVRPLSNVIASSQEAVVQTVPEVPGKAKEVPSVPVKVNVLEAVKVLPLAIVSVPVDELIVKPLIEVAVAAPMMES